MNGGLAQERRRSSAAGGRSSLGFRREDAPAAPAPAGSTAGSTGAAPAAAPAFELTATRVAFNNSGAPDPANCAVIAPMLVGLGAGLGGRPQNAMEMVFRIDGTIPPGTEFEITRTVRDVAWQRDAAGVWSRLAEMPPGTRDDVSDADECHVPQSRRIFVLDRPGFVRADARGLDTGSGGRVAADATAFAIKMNFFEWVIARNRSLGIDWRAISRPVFHRWHSIHSVAANAAGTWGLADTPNGDTNEIELGHVSVAGDTP